MTSVSVCVARLNGSLGFVSVTVLLEVKVEVKAEGGLDRETLEDRTLHPEARIGPFGWRRERAVRRGLLGLTRISTR